jgi:glycosyltransferase involved in cell wall biosynthesis
LSGSCTTRALFVCPQLDAGGAERQWAALIPALAARGVGVRVVAIGSGGRALAELRESGIPVRELGGEGAAAGLARLPALLAERKAAPTVVVSWSYNAHALAGLFARLTGTPHVINWHRQPGFLGSGIQERATQLAGCLGAGAIAVSDTQIPDLDTLRVGRSRVRVVPNGVPDPIDLDNSGAALRADLDLPADVLVAVLVARLRPEKRVSDFIRAVGSAAERGVRVQGIVVGDGPEDSSLRSEAQAANAPVRFVGFQQDPRRYILAGDVTCLTSGFEALPMALIEAAACGRACVTTDVGGTREIVIDGESGFVVAPGDVEAFAGALERLATGAGLAQRMGRVARQRWHARFTFERMVDKYAELLSSVSGPPTAWHDVGATT